MGSTIRYIMLSALRDWLFVAILALLGAVALGAYFFGYISLIENAESATVYFAGAGRLVLVMGATVFTCFHIRRSVETKEIELLLSKPLSRTALVVGLWLGFAATATLLLLPFIALLALFGHPATWGFWAWAGSMWLEVLLVVSIAMAFALILGSAVTAVLASLGFYALSRLMGFFVVVIDSDHFSLGNRALDVLVGGSLKLVSTVVPRLDLFASTSWLVYGDTALLWAVVLQSAVYIPLLVLVAAFDLNRKQF